MNLFEYLEVNLCGKFDNKDLTPVKSLVGGMGKEKQNLQHGKLQLSNFI